MRTIILISALFTLVVIASAQQPAVGTPAPTRNDYLKKSKKQKTIAWITLAGGIAVGFTGLTQINLAGSEGNINNTPGTVMFFAGVASSLVSIPFFIASKRNKKKAISLSFENNTVPWLCDYNLNYSFIPSISLKVGL